MKKLSARARRRQTGQGSPLHLPAAELLRRRGRKLGCRRPSRLGRSHTGSPPTQRLRMSRPQVERHRRRRELHEDVTAALSETVIGEAVVHLTAALLHAR